MPRLVRSILIATSVPLMVIGSRTSGSQDPNRSTSLETAGNSTLDAAERQNLVDAAAANLRQYYFDRIIGQATANALLAHERNGDDSAAVEGAAFANLLTTQMRAASHDMHLVIECSRDKIPEGLPVQTSDDLALHRNDLQQNNCFIRKTSILPNNIGYLKIDWFAELSVCRQSAVAAMASLNQSNAVIIDLRDNSGGFPDMVSLIASYFFNHPEYMYGPRGAPSEESWTHSPVPGNRLADKPVFILTSAATWSGGEQFSYDLKMMKRATLVGETTRGGAHAGVFHRIDDHFGMGIPEEKPINPFGKVDWEGVGVQPDVKVRATDALETAEDLARVALQKKQGCQLQ